MDRIVHDALKEKARRPAVCFSSLPGVKSRACGVASKMIAKVLWGNSLESQLDPYVFAIVNSDLRTYEQRVWASSAIQKSFLPAGSNKPSDRRVKFAARCHRE
jgi:hypothetical protein